MKRSILIVDDEEDLRSLLRHSLEEEFEVLEAKDGQEGFNLALERKPDLIISDIKMPILNGFEMVSKLRQEEVFSAVIFITAFGDFSKQAEATRLAAFDFLEKPIVPNKLLQTVKNALMMGTKLISTLTSGEAVVLSKEKEYGPYVINNMPNSLVEKLQSYCATRGQDPQKLIIQWISDHIEKA